MDKKIVLIGHGVSALEKPNGSVIDKFDEVYRFINGLESIENYKEFIGTKITHIVYKNKGSIDISNIINTNKNIKILQARKYIKLHKNLLFREYYNKIYNITNNERKFRYDFKARNGLKLIFYLLKNYKQIYIYGFDLTEKKNEYVFKFFRKKGHKTGHNTLKETEIILKLIEDGRIKLL